MLLVWGRRWYGKRLGYVGEFCEICRRPQPFTLTKMTLIGHFWYLPMGTHYGSVHRGRCLQCGTEIDTARERYGNVARRKAPARELLDATFPNHEQVLKARLEAERVVRGDPRALAPETRDRLVDLPFVILSPITERRFGKGTQMDWPVGLALLSVVLLPILLDDAARAVAPDHEGTAVLAGVLIGLGLTVWQIAMVTGRWKRHYLLPRLRTALAPLKPTQADFDRVLSEMRQHGHRLGKVLRPQDLAPLAAPAERRRS